MALDVAAWEKKLATTPAGTSRQTARDRLPDHVAEPRASRFLDVLRDELRGDLAAYGIRDAMCCGGERLLRALSALLDDVTALDPPPAGWPASPADWFLTTFVRAVAGDGNTIADGVVRRAATAAAERLLGDSSIATRTEASASRGLPVDVFRAVYTNFVEDVVTEFARSVIAEQVTLTFPALVVIDPVGGISECVGETVAGRIPDPRAQAERKRDARRIDELVSDVLRRDIDRALGIRTEETP